MDITALHKLSYGLYVLGVKNIDGCKYGGCIVDAVAQVSSEPNPLLVVACMKNNRTQENIKSFSTFTLSVLPTTVNPFLIANFGFQSSKTVDKWVYIPHRINDDLPIIADAIAYLRCDVLEYKTSDTHVVFTCKTVDAYNGSISSQPLIYADYLQKIRPLSALAFKAFKETGKSPML
ncbi:MAG: flavin reductase family protein [Christensenellaceae bacterium]|jgi:flavin reductase (DIM6/NTAB) family NADH-FMN oxidoreductase RutF|nr:flavin reductase family protein [Christensenellaceae bacterium]